jgi:hypothetical protein
MMLHCHRILLARMAAPCAGGEVTPFFSLRAPVFTFTFVTAVLEQHVAVLRRISCPSAAEWATASGGSIAAPESA